MDSGYMQESPDTENIFLIHHKTDYRSQTWISSAVSSSLPEKQSEDMRGGGGSTTKSSRRMELLVWFISSYQETKGQVKRHISRQCNTVKPYYSFCPQGSLGWAELQPVKGMLSVLPAAWQGTAQGQGLCWSTVSAAALTYPAAQLQLQQDSLILTKLTMPNPTMSQQMRWWHIFPPRAPAVRTANKTWWGSLPSETEPT